MIKILFAINQSVAEQAISQLITDENTKVVGTVVSQDSIKDFISSSPVDILVYREGLVGTEDEFKFVIKLKMNTPNLRIVFIAGDRQPGDKEIPILITYGIYDIIAGQSVNIKEIANIIKNPNTLNDVIKYLPNRFMNNGVFSEDELSDIENKEKVETEDLEKIEKGEDIEQNTSTNVQQNKKFGMSLKEILKQKTKNNESNVKNNTEEIKTETIDENNVENNTEENIIPEQDIKVPRGKRDNDNEMPDIISENITPEENEDDDFEIDEQFYQNNTQTNIDNSKIDNANKAFNKRVYSASDDELENVKKQLKEQEKKNKQLEKQLRSQEISSKKALLEKDKQLRNAQDEFSVLEQQFDSNSKQRVVMFYSVMPGVGTSTVALNTATFLALKKYKVAYIEFNEYLPTLSYWYDLADLNDGLENCFLGIESRTYQDIPKNIITKQKILSLNSDLKDKHEKYPELLNYLVFSESYIKRGELNKISPNTLKDLMLTLLYKEGYDYVILDMYSHTDHSLIEMSSIFSSTNVFVMTQDVVTIGNSLRKFAALESSGLDFEMLDISIQNKRKSMEPTENYKNFYVINKFNENSLFTRKKIAAWLNTDKKIITIPENSTEILNATYKGLPTILISKNQEFVFQIKKLSEII